MSKPKIRSSNNIKNVRQTRGEGNSSRSLLKNDSITTGNVRNIRTDEIDISQVDVKTENVNIAQPHLKTESSVEAQYTQVANQNMQAHTGADFTPGQSYYSEGVPASQADGSGIRSTEAIQGNYSAEGHITINENGGVNRPTGQYGPQAQFNGNGPQAQFNGANGPQAQFNGNGSYVQPGGINNPQTPVNATRFGDGGASVSLRTTDGLSTLSVNVRGGNDMAGASVNVRGGNDISQFTKAQGQGIRGSSVSGSVQPTQPSVQIGQKPTSTKVTVKGPEMSLDGKGLSKNVTFKPGESTASLSPNIKTTDGIKPELTQKINNKYTSVTKKLNTKGTAGSSATKLSGANTRISTTNAHATTKLKVMNTTPKGGAVKGAVPKTTVTPRGKSPLVTPKNVKVNPNGSIFTRFTSKISNGVQKIASKKGNVAAGVMAGIVAVSGVITPNNNGMLDRTVMAGQYYMISDGSNEPGEPTDSQWQKILEYVENQESYTDVDYDTQYILVSQRAVDRMHQRMLETEEDNEDDEYKLKSVKVDGIDLIPGRGNYGEYTIEEISAQAADLDLGVPLKNYYYLGIPEGGSSAADAPQPTAPDSFPGLDEGDSRLKAVRIHYNNPGSRAGGVGRAGQMYITYYPRAKATQYLGQPMVTGLQSQLQDDNMYVAGWSTTRDATTVEYGLYQPLTAYDYAKLRSEGENGVTTLYPVWVEKQIKVIEDELAVVSSEITEDEKYAPFISPDDFAIQYGYINSEGDLNLANDENDIIATSAKNVIYKTILAMATVLTGNTVEKEADRKFYVDYCETILAQVIGDNATIGVEYNTKVLTNSAGTDIGFKEGSYKADRAVLTCRVTIFRDIAADEIIAKDTTTADDMKENGGFLGLFTEECTNADSWSGWNEDNIETVNGYINMSNADFVDVFHVVFPKYLVYMSGNDVRAKVFNTLIRKNWSEAAALGVVANMEYASQLDPDYSDGDKYGLLQWNKEELVDYLVANFDRYKSDIEQAIRDAGGDPADHYDGGSNVMNRDELKKHIGNVKVQMAYFVDTVNDTWDGVYAYKSGETPNLDKYVDTYGYDYTFMELKDYKNLTNAEQAVVSFSACYMKEEIQTGGGVSREALSRELRRIETPSSEREAINNLVDMANAIGKPMDYATMKMFLQLFHGEGHYTEAQAPYGHGDDLYSVLEAMLYINGDMTWYPIDTGWEVTYKYFYYALSHYDSLPSSGGGMCWPDIKCDGIAQAIPGIMPEFGYDPTQPDWSGAYCIYWTEFYEGPSTWYQGVQYAPAGATLHYGIWSNTYTDKYLNSTSIDAKVRFALTSQALIIRHGATGNLDGLLGALQNVANDNNIVYPLRRNDGGWNNSYQDYLDYMNSGKNYNLYYDCGACVALCLQIAGIIPADIDKGVFFSGGDGGRSALSEYITFYEYTNVDELMPGDILLYYSSARSDNNYIGHVDVYVGDGLKAGSFGEQDTPAGDVSYGWSVDSGDILYVGRCKSAGRATTGRTEEDTGMLMSVSKLEYFNKNGTTTGNKTIPAPMIEYNSGRYFQGYAAVTSDSSLNVGDIVKIRVSTDEGSAANEKHFLVANKIDSGTFGRNKLYLYCDSVSGYDKAPYGSSGDIAVYRVAVQQSSANWYNKFVTAYRDKPATNSN